jgi:hypothetical protein
MMVAKEKMKNLVFIPDPREIEEFDGWFAIPETWSVHLSGNGAMALKDHFSALFPECAFAGNPEESDITAYVDENLSFSECICGDVVDQGYQLTVDAEKIELVARTPKGIFYGLQTLRQILNQTTNRIPAVRITDWPEMPFRGVHLTLGSGHMPTFEQLKELIENFSHCKINRFIMEYDDRFQWERHPAIAHADALSKNQIRSLINHAKKHHVEIIPLLDSLGHAQAYLKHDEYKHLAELPGDTAEMCPANPLTLKFIKELWSEILEVHQNCEFAHISGDEVFRLSAFCPDCQTFADKGRLSEVYCDYYGNLSRWMLEHGRRPIIWADMILKFPNNVSTLPKEVIFNDWDYRGGGPEWTVTRMLNTWGLTIDNNNLNDVPPEHRRHFEKYYLNEDKKTFKPFPGIEILKDYGFEVLASSSSSTESGMNLTSPPFSVSINNNRYIAKAVLDCGAMGMLNTFWSSNHSIIASMHGIWAGAAYSWKFQEEGNSAFLDKCEKVMIRSNTGLFSKFAVRLDGYNLPDAGVFSPIQKDDCPKKENFPLPTPDKPSGAIVADYCKCLATSAGEMVDIQKTFASAQAGLPLSFGVCDYTQIDLRPYMNTNHASVIHLTGRNFSPMGTGRKACRGVIFDIVDPERNGGRSAIGLRGPHMPHWLDSVEIDINDTFKALFFLNSCAYAPDGEIPAVCEINYSDGAVEKYNFELGENVGDWNKANFKLRSGAPAFTWYTYDDAGTLRSSYICRWANPFPENEITKLRLTSGTSEGYAFFFAITAKK